MRVAAALSPLLVVACLLLAATPAMAQWKWKDAAGHTHYSDTPPPSGTPERDILQRPPMAPQPTSRLGEAQRAAASDATSASASAAASGVDPALEARRRKLAEDEALQAAARLKADQDKQAAQRRDVCEQARAQLRTLDDGMRISRVNAQGEREYLDDRARAAERARAQDAVNSQCR